MISINKKIDCVKKANSILRDSLKRCLICPRRCGVDRSKGKLGYCRAGSESMVYSFSAHNGEEPAISGGNGSGTIFFSNCNMKCVYCQNYYFSQLDSGTKTSSEGLSSMMIDLQDMGCHNINLVSPSHYLPQILAALGMALSKGLSLPIIYNTSGYELPKTIKMLDGIVDIYLVDMRYSDNTMAKIYSDAPDYVEHNKASILEMQRQVGDLLIDEDGIARRGLIIRLLAIPGNISGTVQSLKFIRDHVSKDTYISIMSQYYPTFKAYEYKEISRGISRDEYKNIVDEASLLGLNNGWVQEIPDEFDTRFLGTNIKPS